MKTIEPSIARTRLPAFAALAVGAVALGACGGGGEDSGQTSTATATVGQVSACFEDLGQHPRKVETSFAKVPPDLGVSSSAGSANVWVTDDTQAVIDQEEEFAKLDQADAVTPVEDKIVQSGNVIAVIGSDSSPDYRDTITECIPPSG
jgi:sugar (pentulose or hexulose) kinase